MTDKLLCPFCNKTLQPTLRQSDEYWCENYDCPGTNIEWVGSQKLWQQLIKLMEEKQHKNTTTDQQDEVWKIKVAKMSKDIWHTSNEKPEQLRYYLEEYDKFSDGIGYLVNKRYGVGNTIDDLTTKRWCYVDELLALETENKYLSDKIGKLQSKLDIAVKALKWIDETYELGMGYEAAIREKCQIAPEQITTLEQKDK